MKNLAQKQNQKGFTLAELLVSSVVFLLLAGSAFSLLSTSSQRYKTDSQVLTSFQEARLGIDQITRDIADAGFPPANHFNTAVVPPTPTTSYAASPFAWAPGYPVPCVTGGTCTVSPTGFDLIVETDYDGTGVKWIRYQLPAGDTILYRAVVPKTGGDPDAATNKLSGNLLPYIQNVMNNGTAAQIAAITADYPTMFPGGNPVPIFTYPTFDKPSAALGGGCTSIASTPCNIRDVGITLIVQALSRDAKTQVVRVVELNGLAHRLNPNQ
jgi:prepilin-type N-terminal cleavage/methylation domain-containing protein